MSFVASLEPQALWSHFDRILAIPRGSKNEEAMRRYVIAAAGQHGLDHATDTAGNLVVRKPGRAGTGVTILQSHLDMVNEKNSDVAHDFSKDPIVPRRDGDYITASGTTLGSDNGIGVAAMLALMEAPADAYGPLELLFTIDEETGLTGASELDGSLLTGRRLLNLDSEEENTVTVGCAGGASSTIALPVQREPPPGATALSVRIFGLHGGHSGIDIHLQRGNAIKLLARVLHAAAQETELRVADLTGGNMHNAIPREASAVIVPADAARAERAVRAEFDGVRAELRLADPGIALAIDSVAMPALAWSAATSAAALRLLEALPHGVIAMSQEIPELVETSTNVATAGVQDDSLVVLTSSRSSVASALRALRRRIRAIAGLAGATVSEAAGYPGWQPNLASPLLKTFLEVHRAVVGREPEVKAIHAGLECGIIGEKVPGMDMISFGPQIEHPHSPNERVHIESVARFYRLLTATLARLAT